ncbi:MAG: hypothetical protein HY705_10600 [Gemmatimonadetes bacterium]|nr:hypothetical protein [Gemmatimonadota bacterium]
MGAVGLAFSPIGRAIGRSLGGAKSEGYGAAEVEDLRVEVTELRRELEAMHARLGQLDEVSERLDFAERMLAQARKDRALPGAPDVPR